MTKKKVNLIVTKAPKPPVKKEVDKVIRVNENNWNGTDSSHVELQNMVMPLFGYSWSSPEGCWLDAEDNHDTCTPPFEGKSAQELVDISTKLLEIQKQLPDVEGDATLYIYWDDWDGIQISFSGSRYKTLEEVAKENAAYDKAYAAYEKRLAAYNAPASKEAIKLEKERKAKLAEIAAKEKEIKDLRKSLLKKRA